MGLQYPDPTPLTVTEVLKIKLWPRFLRLPIAHVKDGKLVPLSHYNAAVTCNGVVSTAAVPLARMDFEFPGEALVKDKCASLVVLVMPEKEMQIF